MEMLRTVIVALFFAGITVCSYYFLTSSPLWEDEGALTAQTDFSGDNTRNEKETPRTFAQDETVDSGNSAMAQADSPFATSVGSENDEFGLPGLDDLPEPGGLEKTESLVADAPVLDSDLPSLGDSSGKSPFEMAPEAVSAAPDVRIGTSLDPQTLPENTDLPPGPELSVGPELSSGPELSVGPELSSGPELSVGPELSSGPSDSSTVGVAVSGGVSNPLRGGEAPRLASTSGTPQNVPAVSSPAISGPTVSGSGASGPAVSGPAVSGPTVSGATVPVSAGAVASATVDGNSADAEMVREYLKIASEKIQKGAALEVLKSLSKFYGDARFSAEELVELTNILVQAATQVIYSQKHLMEPAYVVQAGDTLDKIASEYQIPAEFIARVNGLTAPFELAPGKELKVIRGPFQAIVYLDRHEMILTLKGLFAGRFWIGVGGELVRKDGDFCFGQRVQTPSGTGVETSYEFLRQAGVPGCCDLLKIEAARDPNQIGTDALSGNILMSQMDVDCLGALLGTGSQLIMRCESPRCIAKPVATSGSVASGVSAPGVAPVAIQGASVGSVGNQASISNTQVSEPISPAGTQSLQGPAPVSLSGSASPLGSASNTEISQSDASLGLGNVPNSGVNSGVNSGAQESDGLDSLPTSLDALPGTTPASDAGSYDMMSELPASL